MFKMFTWKTLGVPPIHGIGCYINGLHNRKIYVVTVDSLWVYQMLQFSRFSFVAEIITFH